MVRWYITKDFIYYLKNDIGRIDFILITGDIIDKGQYDNINLVKQAKSFLNSLKDVVNDHIIFAIGNHDYQREEARFAILKIGLHLEIKMIIRGKKNLRQILKNMFRL